MLEIQLRTKNEIDMVPILMKLIVEYKDKKAEKEIIIYHDGCYTGNTQG